MDIVSKIDFQHATIITSKAHAIRGDHYHKKKTTILLKKMENYG